LAALGYAPPFSRLIRPPRQLHRSRQHSNQPALITTTNSPADAVAAGTNDNGSELLRMNFRGASLEMVLNYLSEAAGFIINLRPGTSIRGKVDVWSKEPLTRAEALNLLDSGPQPERPGRDS